MTYVEGFVVPVPTANKEEYLKHAADAAPIATIEIKEAIAAYSMDVAPLSLASSLAMRFIGLSPWFIRLVYRSSRQRLYSRVAPVPYWSSRNNGAASARARMLLSGNEAQEPEELDCPSRAPPRRLARFRSGRGGGGGIRRTGLFGGTGIKTSFCEMTRFSSFSSSCRSPASSRKRIK